MESFKIICPVCGHENPMTAKLCERDGSVLSIETQNIGNQIEDSQIRGPKLGSRQPGKKLYLHVKGGKESIEVDLTDGCELLVGRRDISTNTIPAIDLTNYKGAELGVSRKHVTLSYHDQMLKITDLGSSNHTWLNGQPLTNHQARMLRDGDEVRLGHLYLKIQFSA